MLVDTSSGDNCSPEHVFGFSGESPTDLENLINILKHSSELPKGFCVIATYKLPIESFRVIEATLAILKRVDISNPQMILFGALLSESLLESAIVKKLVKKQQCRSLANELIPLFFLWNRYISEDLCVMCLNIFMRCFTHIRTTLKMFPTLISTIIAQQIQSFTQALAVCSLEESTPTYTEEENHTNKEAMAKLPNEETDQPTEMISHESDSVFLKMPQVNPNYHVNFVKFIRMIINKLKFRKIANVKNGFLDLEIVLETIIKDLLNRTEMDELKDISIEVVCDIFSIVQSRPLLEQYINSSSLSNSPLTLSILTDNFNIIEEEIQQKRDETVTNPQKKPRAEHFSRKREKLLLHSTSANNLATYNLSEGPTKMNEDTIIEFNDTSTISKELLKSKLKRSQSQTSIGGKNVPSSFMRSLGNLTHLNLEGCAIRSIDNLHFCTNLRVLYLGGNQIQKIEGLDKLIHLTQLYLQDNRITKIQGLNTLTALKKLNLERNNIKRLEGMTHNRLLSELYLSGQQNIDSTPFNEMDKEETLQGRDGESSHQLHETIQEDNPSEVEFTFDLASLYSLQHSLSILSLSNCNLKNASDLSILNNIQKLDLSKNDINSIDCIMEVLANYSLYDLNLSGNPICKIPKYRDKIILNSTHSLQILDGKQIQTNVRSFLINKKKHQMSLKPMRTKTSSTGQSGINDQGEIMKIVKPKIYIGSRYMSHSKKQTSTHPIHSSPQV